MKSPSLSKPAALATVLVPLLIAMGLPAQAAGPLAALGRSAAARL